MRICKRTEVCSVRLKVKLEGQPKEFELVCSYNHGQGSLYVLNALGFNVQVVEVTWYFERWARLLFLGGNSKVLPG